MLLLASGGWEIWHQQRASRLRASRVWIFIWWAKKLQQHKTFLSGVFCMGASKDAAFHASLDFLTPTLSRISWQSEICQRHSFSADTQKNIQREENFKFPHFSRERSTRALFCHTHSFSSCCLRLHTFYKTRKPDIEFSFLQKPHSAENRKTKADHFLRPFKMRAETFF